MTAALLDPLPDLLPRVRSSRLPCGAVVDEESHRLCGVESVKVVLGECVHGHVAAFPLCRDHLPYIEMRLALCIPCTRGEPSHSCTIHQIHPAPVAHEEP